MSADILTAQVQDTRGATAQATFTIPIVNPVSMSCAPPAATQGSAYSTAVSFSGGTPAYSLLVISQTLGNGWTASGTNIVGTPTIPGTDTLILLGNDANGIPQSIVVTIAINAAGGSLTISPDGGFPIPQAAVGIEYQLGLTVTNSANLISWAVISGPGTVSSTGTSTGLYDWLSPTPQGVTGVTIQATDTVTLNTGTITL